VIHLTEAIERQRLSWDDLFFKIAEDVSKRSVCFRSPIGAVIVRDNKYIVSMGYNGAPTYQPNCAEIGWCYRETNGIKSGTELERCRACGSHAESNAISLAARNGSATNCCSLYMFGKTFVCTQCKAIIANAGIIKVMIKHPDGTDETFIPSVDWTVHDVDK